MIRSSTYKGKTVAVFGLGKSGLSAARALLAGGAEVAAWDDAQTTRSKAEEAGIPLVDLRTAQWTSFAPAS